MSNPIKLTDEVLNKLDHALVNSWQMDRLQIIEAIRTLRDYANAVCASANPSTALSMVPGYEDETPVSTAALARLKEILP